MRLQLSPGSYLVQVYSNLASGGNYALTYTFTAGAPAPCLPATLNPGDAPAGTLSVLSCRTELGLTDLYTLTLPAAGTLSLNLAATSLIGQIAIRDTKDNLIALNQDLEGLGDSNITAVLPAGTYTLAAAAVEGSGAYQLTTTFAANPLPLVPRRSHWRSMAATFKPWALAVAWVRTARRWTSTSSRFLRMAWWRR